MSSNRNKPNFRQASLTYDPPTINPRRPGLTKQNSEDSTMPKKNEIKITLSAKCKRTPHDFPPTKVAWSDEGNDEKDPLITRKCPENRKPPRSLKRQSSVDQDSILSCKDDIITKLRLLLKDDAEISEKPNLSIFLNQNPKHPRHDDNDLRLPQDLHTNQVHDQEETIVQNSESKCNSVASPTTSLFQFRKTPVNKFQAKYSPNHQDQPREPPNIVVTPVSDINMDEERNISTNTTITDNSQPINNVIIRPTTAKSRRELFSKRTNSAFNSFAVNKEGNNQRAPLQRSSSAPIRPEHAKSKFLATKRRLKTNRRRDLKSAKKQGCEENSSNTEVVDSSNAIPKNATEIITMVSLVSPASSDIDEIPDIEEEAVKTRTNSPKKTPCITRREDNVQITSSLRKIVKQVSFQQSSIHAIRSFSAGFPGRKNSIAASMMLGGNLKRSNTVQKKQEKNVINASVTDGEERVPKRRLVRSHSAHVEVKSPEEEHHEKNQEIMDYSLELPGDDDEDKTTEGIQKSPIKENSDDLRETELTSNLAPMIEEEMLIGTEVQDGQQFFTPKEKECWVLYQKMNDKGVKVNYDTLLRGMLTPTEYRNRRQSLAACASFDTEETTENVEQAT
ncbi:uncharacterized protein LOC123318757 [Coccinella septempunctata]|uniref:uncharacterized protein LOC123318757 n=1 Tax=Coccinella septempunctata TaxID=41139 RepID=UPI001D0765AD|nr:uncharacterized protein LOC123318757 [Coccinella septempunctata]